MIPTFNRSKVKSRSSNVTVILPTTKVYDYPSGVFNSEFGGGAFELVTDIAKIAYTTRDPLRPGHSNSCVHNHSRKEIRYIGPISLLSATVAAPTARSEYTGYTFWSNSAHTQAVVAAKAAFGISIEDALFGLSAHTLIQLGYDRMKPDLTMVSLPNALLELGQIRSLFKIWSGRRSLVKNVAGAHLNVQYGWLPTIGDISTMIEAVKSLRTKLRDWNRNAGKIISRRTTVLKEAVSKSGVIASQPFTRADIHWRGRVEHDVTAFLVYKVLPIKRVQQLDTVIKAYLDTLGFELNPAIIWDAIPFTFVIDWFLNVGNILERFKIDTLELPIRVEDSFLQHKETISYESTVYDRGDANNPKWTYPGATTKVKYFRRLPITPDPAYFLSSPGWKSPNLKQWTNALALAVTRGRNF